MCFEIKECLFIWVAQERQLIRTVQEQSKKKVALRPPFKICAESNHLWGGAFLSASFFSVSLVLISSSLL